ncbi:MAG: ImmA/IrrE family metallo-endopeptidase [Thermovirgaceae bacterium]|nr:ImmA/IrrE family metallo-endopeptidase [Thermovirgaceae bacterium]
MPDRADPEENEALFEWPSPPEDIPRWALKEASPWRDLDDFNLLALAEETCGRIVELIQVSLPETLWGLHIARGRRARIYVNRQLPRIWRRFSMFHELYHLLHHTRGEAFWSGTATPMTSFEHQADMFAWAAIHREWIEGSAP